MGPTQNRPKVPSTSKAPLYPSWPLIMGGAAFLSIITVGSVLLFSHLAADDVVRPTEVIQPADRQACTVELESTDKDQLPNQATVSCGGQETTLAGDFREQTTNRYTPDTSNGITSILVVGDEGRVYMTYGEEETCSIIFSEGDDPTTCEPTTVQEHTAS